MRDVSSKEIAGRTYEVTMLDEKTSRQAFLRLGRLLGPSLAELSKGLTGGAKSLGDMSIEVVANAVARLLYNMSEDDLEYFCAIMRKTTKVKLPDGPLVQLADGMFRGQLANMFKWLRFCLETNYADFLDELRSASAPLNPMSKIPDESSSVSPSE